MSEHGLVPAISPDRCCALPAFIESTAKLEKGSYGDGFPSSRGGIDAYELLGPNREPLLFIVVDTGPLSNDHLARYELLYDNSVHPPQLIDRRYWYRDVAGLEGLEFASISAGLTMAFLAIALPPVGVVLVVRGIKRRRRMARGLCSKCAYPIGGSERCPECGTVVSAMSAD
jgi:hypothetical protein